MTEPDYDETGRVRRELVDAQIELENLLRRYVFGGDIAETFLCGFGPLSVENKRQAGRTIAALADVQDAIGQVIADRVSDRLMSATLNYGGDKRITSSPLYDWWNEAEDAIRRGRRPPLSFSRNDWSEAHAYSREIERRMPGTKAHSASREAKS